MPACVVAVVRIDSTASPEPPGLITDGEIEARRSSASVVADRVTSPVTVVGMNVVNGTVVVVEFTMTGGVEMTLSGRTTIGPGGVGCGVVPGSVPSPLSVAPGTKGVAPGNDLSVIRKSPANTPSLAVQRNSK